MVGLPHGWGRWHHQPPPCGLCLTLHRARVELVAHRAATRAAPWHRTLVARAWGGMVSAVSTAVVMMGDPVAGLAGEVPIPHLHVPLGINLLAVGVGAIVGTLRAGESDDVDVVGMFVLALCFGFGGAIVRDLLLGHLPPAAFRNPAYITVVLAATVVGSIFPAYLDHLERPLWVLDSLSIGLFAAVGTNAALLSGLAFLPAVFIGTMASAGGGVLADVLQGRPSALLHRGPPNVLAGLAGAMAYAVSYDLLSEQAVTPTRSRWP